MGLIKAHTSQEAPTSTSGSSSQSKGIENITFIGIAFYGKKLKVSYK